MENGSKNGDGTLYSAQIAIFYPQENGENGFFMSQI
jgi:hypothetical protein